MKEWSGYTYIFEPEANRVRVSIHGVLDNDVLPRAFRAVYSDENYLPGMHELCDCREVSKVEMTAEGVRVLTNVISEMQTSTSPYRVGIVAPKSVVFGLARMYELLQDEEVEQVQVFDSLEDAEKFTSPDE